MRYLETAVYVFPMLGFLLWSLRTGTLTRGPAGSLGALLLLLPAAFCAGLAAVVYLGRIKPWGWVTRGFLVLYALLFLLVLAYLPQSRAIRRQREESRTVTELKGLRKALAAWKKDTGSVADRPSALVGRYIPALPRLSLPGTPHPITREVEFAQTQSGVDSGMWLYVDNPGNPFYGQIRINCTHKDLRGVIWSSY